MKVLITGHRGFIGRNVFADWQSTHNHLVVGMDFPYDISDFDGGEYELVIHLAAFANIRDSLENPQKFYENNVVKSKKLFDWCRETNTRLLYASSSAVEEDYWENPYAMTKWINEQMAPPNSVGMRFTTVYGPDSRPDMMYRMLEDKTATYVTNHRRDWIHVKDVCRAIRYLASSKICGPVSVGSGRSVSVRELADKMGMGHLPVKEVTPGERQDNVADVSLLTSTGWFPTINVLDTINDNPKLATPL
jgi:UDP-glucose 4-epimerase